MGYNRQQKIAELRRELRFREHVYERNIRKGLMNRREAEYQIDVLKEILADYSETEPKQEELI